MMLIVAPQPYYEALDKGIIEPGFFRFMAQYLSFHDFAGEAWGGEDMITWTWNHLWYLPYLLFYSLLLIPMAIFIDRRGAMSGFSSTRQTPLTLRTKTSGTTY